MAALVAAIHAFEFELIENVDGRHKAGHDRAHKGVKVAGTTLAALGGSPGHDHQVNSSSTWFCDTPSPASCGPLSRNFSLRSARLRS